MSLNQDQVWKRSAMKRSVFVCLTSVTTNESQTTTYLHELGREAVTIWHIISFLKPKNYVVVKKQ